MEKKIKVTTPMCMNPMVMSKGRCDYCDARCPYFVTYGALLWTLEDYESSEDVKRMISEAHDMTMQDIEGGGDDL